MELNYNILNDIGRNHGDAFYLLDTEQFELNFHELLKAFRKFYPETYIAYSYKTNYTPRLCRMVEDMGGYAEVVSDMELEIARRIGVPYSKVHFNGPVKNFEAVREVILGGGIVNLDDYVEVPAITELAAQHPDRIINVGLRCNFQINDGTLSRFGFDVEKKEFSELVAHLNSISNIRISGLHCHFASRRGETWKPRTEGMCKLVDELCTEMPDHVDLGGGLFGKMKNSLKAQFGMHIPTYKEYAQEAAKTIAEHFGECKNQPKLFIEPGSALVGDAMRFAARVKSIKDIRGKKIATLMGSIYNINPTLNKKNPPITVMHDETLSTSEYADLDFAGFTCIESDYLYRGYNGPLSIRDFVVFENVGSYSVVLKPPFILPNFPILELKEGKAEIIKRQETFDDLFHTYTF
ncbi:MAG: pyridoxal-dependent decarboxylase [Prevotella sp.]|nr:pyridoxal-dependent decarboxylase [Prevotella sp.]